MFPWSGVTTFNPIILMTGDGSDVFNWFFTIIMVWGLFCWGVGLLCKIVSRS